MQRSSILKAAYPILCVILALAIVFTVYELSTANADLSDQQQNAQASSSTNIFGVEMVQINPVYGLTQMASIGTPWVRVNGVKWSDIEPVADEMHWEKMADIETSLANAQANGMEVVLVVRSTPSWAQKNPGYTCGPMAENNIKDFAEFLGELVNRYKDRVSYWEIWNEPDVALGSIGSDEAYGCWGVPGDPFYGGGYYGQVLKQIYPAIKASDAQAQVVIGGLLMDCGPSGTCPAPSDIISLKFIEGIFTEVGDQYYDGIAYHAYDYYQGGLANYGNTNWGASRATTGPVGLLKFDYISQIMGEYGIVGKFIMNTEMALVCSSGCNSTFETTKSYYVAQSFSSALARRLSAAFWYGAKMGWRETDLLNADLSPRPAYNAYHFALDELNQAEFAKDITQYSGLMGFEFTRSNDRVWVIWSQDGASHTITLPAFPNAIYRVDGTPWTLSKTVTITIEPYYIVLPKINYLFTPIVMQNAQAILNAGFDRDDANWTFTKQADTGLPAGRVTTSPSFPQLDTNIPIGVASALLGMSNYSCNSVPVGYGGVQQTFTVPYSTDDNPVKLTFKYIIYSQDASVRDDLDWFEVHIISDLGDSLAFRDGNKNTITNCVWYRVPATGWAKGSIDLTSPIDYRGKTVTVFFKNINQPDSFYNTLTYLDQVYIEFGSE